MTAALLSAAIPDLAPLNTAAVCRDISGCYTGDLLSDVLTHAEPGQVLVTVQAHRNTIAVASEKKLAAVIFCNDRQPDADALALAEQRQIPLFSTASTTFETAVLISRLLPNHE